MFLESSGSYDSAKDSEKDYLGTMLLLVLLPLTGLYLVQLLTDALVFVILSAHFKPFIQDGEAAFCTHDFVGQVIIMAVYIYLADWANRKGEY